MLGRKYKYQPEPNARTITHQKQMTFKLMKCVNLALVTVRPVRQGATSRSEIEIAKPVTTTIAGSKIRFISTPNVLTQVLLAVYRCICKAAFADSWQGTQVPYAPKPIRPRNDHGSNITQVFSRARSQQEMMNASSQLPVAVYACLCWETQ